MLSGAAFNALLKTLEEPPKHVMFILATTEYHKLPATITSRCQHHNLKRVGTEIIKSYLSNICSKESFELAPESLLIISKKAEGSVRDALSLLDQIMSCHKSKATHNEVMIVLGITSIGLLHKITKAVFLKDTLTVFEYIDYVYNQGYDLKLFYKDILEYFRHLSILTIDNNSLKLIDLPSKEIAIMREQIENINKTYINQILSVLFKEEIYIKNTNYTKLALEITFLKLQNVQVVLKIDNLIESLDDLKKTISTKHKSPCVPSVYSVPKKKNDTKKLLKNNVREKTNSVILKDEKTLAYFKKSDLNNIWQKVQYSISKSKPSVAVNLSDCFLTEIDSSNFEIEITRNKYVLNSLEKNFFLIKETLQKHIGFEITLKLRNNIKNEKLPKQDSNIEKEPTHSLIREAIKIFEGKIDDFNKK